MNTHSKILGLRTSAIIEIIAFLVIALIADYYVFDGDRFINVSPHPFWIVVILIACQYGTAEGVLAAILSSLVLLVGNLPGQKIESDLYEYLLNILTNPIMWLTAAVFVGEIRQRHIRERVRLQKELVESQEREETITSAYTRLKGLKDNLELKIAGQLRSSIDTYRAAKSIEKLAPTEVIQGVEELVRAVLNPQKFSVYLLGKKGLDCIISSGWEDRDNYSRTYDQKSQLFNEIVGRQAIISVVNSDQQRLLGEHGVLAGPLINRDTGEISGMLKIEKMGFLDLNLSSIETFSAICEWIGMALTNARNYEEARADSVVNPEHKLMTQNYFRRHTDYIAALGKRVGFDVTMIIVKLANSKEINDVSRKKVALSLSDAVNETLRKIDLAFDYQANGEEFAIVLPATDAEGAKIVMNKIMKSLQASSKKTPSKASFSYTLHSLHSVKEA
jgi:GGDEF domain-containing protein